MNDSPNYSGKYYAYRKNYYNWGQGPIYNENAEIIAKYRHWEEPARIEILTLSNKIQSTIFRTKKSNKEFEIRDKELLIMGTLKQKSSKFVLETPNKNKILETSPTKKDDYEISSSLGAKITKVKNTRFWSEVFKGVTFEFGDTIGIEFYDTIINRLLIIGVVLILDWIDYEDFLLLLNRRISFIGGYPG